MRLKLVLVVRVAAVSLLLMATVIPMSAVAQRSRKPVDHGPALASGGRAHTVPNATCYDHLNQHKVYAYIPTQNFEKEYNAYDNRGADDFRLHTSCTVSHVQVQGKYEFTGPARSFRVTLYQDQQGTPGKVISGQKRLLYTQEGGIFDIALITPVTLEPGHYWLSVKPNMDFACCGQWFWMANQHVEGTPSQWKNAGNGFGTGCIDYTTTTTCLAVGPAGDLTFSLIP